MIVKKVFAKICTAGNQRQNVGICSPQICQ